jgi:hypothetical protein
MFSFSFSLHALDTINCFKLIDALVASYANDQTSATARLLEPADPSSCAFTILRKQLSVSLSLEGKDIPWKGLKIENELAIHGHPQASIDGVGRCY